MRSDYRSRSFLALGYTEIRLSRKAHRQVFPGGKFPIHRKGRYFIKGDVDTPYCVAHYTQFNILGKLYATLTLPLEIILQGLSDTSRTWGRYMDIMKYGDTGDGADIIYDKDTVLQIIALGDTLS